ncbi:MAG: rhodanese [Thiotrichaceae bacterium]|nr:MAG: rhodanese [Thiotrichaceae bacterium]
MAQFPSKHFIQTLLLLCLLSIIKNSFADDYTSPDSIKGSTTINAEDLIKLAQDHDDLIIIDSRIKSDRRQGYISGSVSLPDTDTNCVSLLPVIDNKATPTVFYCNGPKCRRSDIAISKAAECGYKNLYWFRGGFKEWKEKNYLISK